MKTPYEFSTLRYIYDPVTLEFVNVGLVIYAPKQQFLRAYCTQQYSRVSKLFRSSDGMKLRHTLRHIQDDLNALGGEIAKGLLFADLERLHDVLKQVLPHDDSSLQFVRGGVGLATDLMQTGESLFDRYVNAYSHSSDIAKRDDEEVWKTFRSQFERRHILSKLAPKRIVSRDYDYEFQRAWKNGVWNLYEPISFDLQDGATMLDKANRWIGRVTSLTDSSEPYKLFLLLGAPTDSRLENSYNKAQNLLKKMPGKVEFIRESEAEALAVEVKAEMENHG